MTVIEVRGRGGQLLERFRSSRPVLTVGRAYDNDLIIEDQYVSPHHLRLSVIEDGWRFEDTDSLNGFHLRNRPVTDGVLHSGDELRIGNTSLHFYQSKHPVEATLKLDGAEGSLQALGRPAAWFSLVAVWLAASALDMYSRTFSEFKPLAILQPLISGVLVVAGVAAFWALIGRLLRHRANFFAHFSVWLIYSLAVELAGYVAETLAFNANSGLLEQVVNEILSFAILAAAAWSSFVLATNLRKLPRVFSAIGVAAVLLAVSLADQLRFDRQFSSYPEYYSRIGRPELLWVAPVPEEKLYELLPGLFDEADAEVEKDKAEEAERSSNRKTEQAQKET